MSRSSECRPMLRKKMATFLAMRVPNLLCVLLLLLGTFASASPSAVVSIPERGTAIPLSRNSHSTALARASEYWKLKRSDESRRTLTAICWLFIQRCECSKPGKPVIWPVAEGARKLFAARGYGHTPVSEKSLRSEIEAGRVGFPEFASAIIGARPVIVTFCYDAAAGKDATVAKRRDARCFSALATGYVIKSGKQYLICQDGLAGGQTSVASVDRVSPKSLGLPPKGVWSEPGTGIYQWEGKQTNLVFVFVRMP